MTRRRLLAIIAAFWVVAAVPAHAHDVWTYYHSTRWVGDLSVDWRFTTGFPTGSYRSRVLQAYEGWNDLGQPLQLVNVSTDYANWNVFGIGCPTTERRNGVHFKDLTDGAVAVTQSCVASEPTRLWSSNIVVDSVPEYPWWTSTDVVPFTHLDLWSTVAHEVGHMTGFRFGGPTGNPGHWPESDNTLCPGWGAANFADRETMCETIIVGTRVMRTAATHDAHTFGGAY